MDEQVERLSGVEKYSEKLITDRGCVMKIKGIEFV